MVKTKKYNFRKGANWKKKHGRKDKMNVAKRLKSLTEFVYKTIEKKQITTHYSQVVAGDTWYGTDLTEMIGATGSTNTERIGNEVTLSSLQTKISFNLMSPFVTYRIIIVQFPCLDLAIDPNIVIPHLLAVPAVSLVPPLANTNHVLLSPYKVASAIKFNILVDDLISPSSGSNPVKDALANDIYYGSQMIRIYKLGKRVKQKNIQFLAGASATNAYKGIICMYIYNNNSLNDAPTLNYDVISRFTYRDA